MEYVFYMIGLVLHY